jgi:FKBP-type peptidyl-prolyl cis-trans isomerase
VLRAFRSALLLPLALALAASCGSDSTGPSALTIEETTFDPSLGIDLATFTRNSNGLYFKELVVGPGAIAQDAQQVGVYYKGQRVNAAIFDQRQAPQAPFTFRIGSGQVVAGFDQGVRGMRVGGKRQVIIPPALGYGSQGSGPIPPNSILIFTLDLASVQ